MALGCLANAKVDNFVPPYVSDWDDKVNYRAVEMPGEDMTEEETLGLFTGKFWVDGVMSVTADSEGEEWLWVEATVHSP